VRRKRVDALSQTHRHGRSGAEKILAATIKLHGERAKEKEVVVDTTVQEKNITFPTDTKLATKIVPAMPLRG
jgi:IS5 family transposase